MSHSIRALADVAMTYFPHTILNSTPETTAALENAIEQYLQKQISYEQARSIAQRITGSSQPIERLHTIIETDSEPIAKPDEYDDKSKHARHKTRPWTPYEDQRLLAGIYRNGIENWTAISKFVGNARTRSQCSQRWYRGLDPTICKEQWTKEEEEKLIEVINQNGDKSWTQIASKMGNRSDVQCRYKYKHLQKERLKEGITLLPGSHRIQAQQETYERPAVRRLKGTMQHNPKANLPFPMTSNPNPNPQQIIVPINQPQVQFAQPLYPQDQFLSQISPFTQSIPVSAPSYQLILQSPIQPNPPPSEIQYEQKNVDINQNTLQTLPIQSVIPQPLQTTILTPAQSTPATPAQQPNIMFNATMIPVLAAPTPPSVIRSMPNPISGIITTQSGPPVITTPTAQPTAQPQHVVTTPTQPIQTTSIEVSAGTAPIYPVSRVITKEICDPQNSSFSVPMKGPSFDARLYSVY